MPVQIIGKLREDEVLLSQGQKVGEASRKLGITQQTYCRWRREYGGMQLEQAKWLKGLAKENGWLKKLVAESSHGFLHCFAPHIAFLSELFCILLMWNFSNRHQDQFDKGHQKNL